MRVSAIVRSSFCAAHHLEGYVGNCANVHGHTWTVEMKVKMKVNSETGLGFDFRHLKKVLQSVLPDHKNLNEVYEFNPTAENIAIGLFRSLKAKGLKEIESVTVWESSNCGIEVTQRDVESK